MIKFSKILLFPLLITFLYTNNSFSQGIPDVLRLGEPGIGLGARALGMGNSYIGLSDDASAMFFNPAGLALIKEIEVSGGINYDRVKNNTTFFNSKTNVRNNSTKFNRFSIVLPYPTYKGSLVFGAAFQSVKNFNSSISFDGFNNGSNSMIQDLLDTDVPFDLFLTDTANNTPINGKLNQSGNILSKGSINNWAFSGAVEISKNLFVGLTVNGISGSFNSNNDYFEDDAKNLYQGETAVGEPFTTDFKTLHLNRILNWDLKGWFAKAGLLYQINKHARFGATVQFPQYYTIEEQFLVSGYSEFGTGNFVDLDTDKYSDNVRYDIVTPFKFSAGFSFSISGLLLNAEGSYTDYTQLSIENQKGLSIQYVGGVNKDIINSLDQVFSYNLGAEYIIPVAGLRIRGGYFVQPSAYKNDPTQFDKKYVTAGLGFLLAQNIGVDIGYAHGWWKNIGDNYGVNVSRTFQNITSDRILVDLTYRL